MKKTLIAIIVLLTSVVLIGCGKTDDLKKAKTALNEYYKETIGSPDYVVKGDVELIDSLEGFKDLIITWDSKNKTFIGDDGKIVRYPTLAEGNQDVSIVATLTLGSKKETAHFYLYLEAKDPNINDPDAPLVINNNFYDAALLQTYLIHNDFYASPGRIKAYDPADMTPGSEYSGTSALWGYGAYLTMYAQAAKINPNLEHFKTKTYDAIAGLEVFRMMREQLHYSAIVGGGGEPYYDDNAWVVLGLYDIAKVYDDKAVMAQSRDLLNYVLSGESEDGGIYWKETVTSRNTCSSGPAIVAALLHYLENPAEETELLETAVRVYQWTKRVLRDPSDYVYWDNAIYDEQTQTEEINKWKFTYNSGTMIWAASLLYQVTKDATYLDDANKTAMGSLSYFYTSGRDNQKFFPRTPWFNLYLLRGFIALAHQYEDGSKDFLVNAFRENLKYALVKGVDKRGYLLPTWGSGQNVATDQFVALLDVAASAEVLFLLADWEVNYLKETP